MITTSAQAGAPLWTFTPLTATTISMPANGSAAVQYQVTNQSSRAHTLEMKNIKGITQITQGAGVCGNPFLLSGHQSCLLSLQINGDQIQAGNTNGPLVCNQGSALQCYRPSANDTLNINITNSQFSIGGTISGLANTVYLQDNGGDLIAFSHNGAFTFPASLTNGTAYNVTVAAQPANQTCSVANGAGTVNGANVTNIAVTCATNSYTVGGTVTGLSGTVILSNHADMKTITSNGSYTFSTPVAEGSTYQVTVNTQPARQVCAVSNGTGTMGGSNVTNVDIHCLTMATLLNTSISDLALSVTGLTEYGVSGTPSSGLARVITITNGGANTAFNLAVNTPTWPSGTTSTTTCGSTLAAGSSCTITITPGNTATSNGTNPCSTGAAPLPGVIQVTADNASTVSTNVVVLNYSCIYQGGYVYAFDDSTPNIQSVGGKVATTFDQVAAFPNGVVWSSNGGTGGGSGGADALDVSDDLLPGIDDVSTASLGSPTYATFASFFVSTYTNPNPFISAAFSMCNGASDGACNTSNIATFYNQFITNNTQGSGGTPPFTASAGPTTTTFYATGLCKQTINSYSDWYLPAICEMGYGGTACGSVATPTLQNMQSNLVDFNSINLLTGDYWSSTEYSSLPQFDALSQHFAASGGSVQNAVAKNRQCGVRCSRGF